MGIESGSGEDCWIKNFITIKSMKLLEKESDIQRAICDCLALKKHFFWRQNTTPIFDPTKKTFRKMPKYSLKGVPDIIVLWQSGGR